MTIEEAISHAEDVGKKMLSNCNTKTCGEEHLQLAKWLKELKQYRENVKCKNNI